MVDALLPDSSSIDLGACNGQRHGEVLIGRRRRHGAAPTAESTRTRNTDRCRPAGSSPRTGRQNRCACVLEHAAAALDRDRIGGSVESMEAEYRELEKALRRLTAAIAAGGELPSLVDAIATHEHRRAELEVRLAAARAPRPTLDAREVRAKLEGYLPDWKALLRGHVQQGQQILRRLIVGRLTFAPHAEGFYTFQERGLFVRCLLGSYVI
jgi:hypothetical protein